MRVPVAATMAFATAGAIGGNAILERDGLIRRDVNGREHCLTFDARPLRDTAGGWLAIGRSGSRGSMRSKD
jgi:hypothetical protein